MTPLARVEAAILRLEAERDAVSDIEFKKFLYYVGGTPSPFEALTLTLRSTVDPVLELLRGAARYMAATGDYAHDVVLVLADAILGDTQ